jgi:hypothetical protein
MSGCWRTCLISSCPPGAREAHDAPRPLTSSSLHIPKTGGVTLRRTLKWKYSRILSEETDQAAPGARTGPAERARDRAGRRRAPALRRPRVHPARMCLHHRPARAGRAGRLLLRLHPRTPQARTARVARALQRSARDLPERFDETFILLRRVLGWRLPYYVSANVAGAAKPVGGSPRELIRERNQLDHELY